MKKLKHFLWYQFPVIFWAAAIFIQSSMSDIITPDLGFSMQDKFGHLIVYAILGLLLIRALLYQPNQSIYDKAGWLTFLIGSGYAISDEIHQSFVPGRSADVEDVIADIIGIAIVLCIFYIRKLIRQQREKKYLKFGDSREDMSSV